MYAVTTDVALASGVRAGAFPAAFPVGPLKKGIEQKIQAENAERQEEGKCHIVTTFR